MTRPAEVLIHDPVHPYAPRFIEAFARRGMRTVCLYNNREFVQSAPQLFPELVGPNVSANYFVADADLLSLAPLLRERHNIVAVVPHVETSVVASERLAEALNLSWAQPGVVDRFRNKHSLKDHLRSVPGGPRINAIARVTSRSDVIDALGTGDFPRFVLKPNDGFGNSRIGFFEADDDFAKVDVYLTRHAGTPLLMEEFIGGDEYFVDGQVDGVGNVTVVSVWRAIRVAANGRPNVTAGFRTVRHHESDFVAAANYARSVLEAASLRRSPFHLELKIDEHGPCLIEVGARLVGTNLAMSDGEMHGNLDTIEVAAHYYLTSDDYGPTGINWDHYDSHLRTEIAGISEVEGRIFEMSGLAEVEAHPAFVRWHHKPAIGDCLTPTVDLFGQPWALVAEASNDEGLRDITTWIRSTIRINSSSTGMRRQARRAASLVPLEQRVANRVQKRVPLPGRPRIVLEPVDPAPLDADLSHASFSGAEYVVQDPYLGYASDFMSAMSRRGLRAVCMYTDASELQRQLPVVPHLTGSHIAASYLVNDGDLESFAQLLKARHHIVAVLPYVEQAVVPAERLAELMGLEWAQPGVVERFRDKFSLKSHLASLADGPRMNAFTFVESDEDVQRAMASGQFDSFVLKPNDGAGNSRVGFFDTHGDHTALTAYLAENRGTPLIMEEFIGGDEYFANGQVDGRGNVTVVEVARYTRGSANGRPNVSFGRVTLHTDDPDFAVVRDYTEHVMQASGLLRCPFHLELKIDQRGPCLVEVGARLSGSGMAYDDNVLHGSLNVFDLAAHYYLTADDYGNIGLDWARYDSMVLGRVDGVSTSVGRIVALSGVKDVESSPAFVRWVKRPAVGNPIVPTVELYDRPWSVILSADDEAELKRLDQWARTTIRINSRPRTASELGADIGGMAQLGTRLSSRALRRSQTRALPPTPAEGLREPLNAESTSAEFLIQDPFHNYAETFIELLHRQYGMKAVCFYTDADEYRKMINDTPSPRDVRVSASYLVDDGDLAGFAAMLQRDHRITAVIPYFEQSVGPAGQLAELLGLGWAQPGVIERFRNKHSLKDHLRTLPEGPRINAIARVRTLEDVESALASGQFPRFVLKPNDGAGNTHIGFFDADADPAYLRAYLSENAGADLLMEEYIGGLEYFANGQIDALGEVIVISIGRYDRRIINGKANISVGTTSIRTHDSEFDSISSYTVAVMQGSGLRRSPFHLELKLDERGPCLIEVAARLAGTDLAVDDNILHGTLNVFDVAAHYYLTDTEYGPLGLNWERYDSRVYGQLSNTSASDGRIFSLKGMTDIESVDGFVRWVQKPRVGDRLVRTIGVFEYPWIVSAQAATPEALADLGEWMRATLRINESDGVIARRSMQAAAMVPLVQREVKRRTARYLLPAPKRPTATFLSPTEQPDELLEANVNRHSSEVLIQNPYNVYAVRFIELLAKRYGLRTVCVYTDQNEMRHQCWQFPQLRGPYVSANYLVEDGDLEGLSRFISQRHRIAGVIPHGESVVADSDTLATCLGLDWAQPDVRWRFRDKFALKDYLRSVPNGPRINAIAHVSSRHEVNAAVATGNFSRFVLKPNDGAGNVNIGFFSANDDPAALDGYFASNAGTSILMEEFIDGDEFYVDGQVDGVGTVTIVGIYRYIRYEVNGRRNVLSGTRSLRSDSAEFESIANYAIDVLRCSGLRRSPFHLEVKVDDRGPCLIEVAARFVGADGVDLDDELHGTLQVFDLAAHYFLTGTDHGPTGVNWAYADRRVRGQVLGASRVSGRVTAIQGVADVEAHPGFVRWDKPPRLGDRVEPTVDVMHHPWIATIVADSDAELDALREWMHDTITLSSDTDGVSGRLRQAVAYYPGLARTARRQFTPLPRITPYTHTTGTDEASST